MKLFFNKNDDGDIEVMIQSGTVLIPFDYIEMLKQLINNNEIEEPDFGNLEDIEKTKISELLSQIKNAVEEGMHQIE